MNEVKKVLEIVSETEILGKKIRMYGDIDDPYFIASDIAEWLGERDGYTVARKVDAEYKGTQIVCTLGGNQKTTVLNEDGLYDACMLSRKEIAKPLKKAIKAYLKSIRKTGAAIQPGREEEMIDKYFPSFSEETKLQMVNDLVKQNQELKQFFDDLMNTEGLIDINTVGKELAIGEYTLFDFLRKKKVFFYNKDHINVPYEPFRKDGKFFVKETMCRDGKYRATTYATKLGLEYIRKLLHKSGYYNSSEV